MRSASAPRPLERRDQKPTPQSGCSSMTSLHRRIERRERSHELDPVASVLDKKYAKPKERAVLTVLRELSQAYR